MVPAGFRHSMLASVPTLSTLAVFEIDAPPSADAFAVATTVNVALAPAASVAMVPVIVPVPPLAGLVSTKVGPVVCIAEAKVVPTGMTSVSTTPVAVAVPEFVTVIV